LRLRDLQSRQGVMHFRIKGKRDKVRFIPVRPMALRLPRRLLVRARFSAAAFAAMMSGYVQSPLGNSEHGENRCNESHTGHAEWRVE
jgi:hypothetical protein